jgi:GrpB-like predicted nucleotidyltransferase (UPF0157 family)
MATIREENSLDGEFKYMGLPYNVVKLEVYNPDWPKQFEQEKEEILSVVKNSSIAICHIGSTSIPNMTAKPIIDIMVGVDNNNEYDSTTKSLISIGYHCLGECGRPDRIFFVKGSPDNNTHHLHLVTKGSSYWVENLAFREYLRQNSKAANEYQALKIDLAHKYRDNRTMYRIAKSYFIDEILQRL